MAPIEAGQKMTEVDIWLNDDCVAEAELYAMNDVRLQENAVSGDRNSPTTNVPNQPVKKGGMSWGWIILIVFLIAAILILLPRIAAAYRYKQKKARMRRRRKSIS